MELFYHPRCRYSQKVLIAFYEKQLNFSQSIIELANPMERAHFNQLYPAYHLPLLKIKQGQFIPESSIIIEYIAHHFSSGSQLLPPTIDSALEIRLWDRLIDNDMNAKLTMLEQLKQETQQNQLQIKQQQNHLIKLTELLDKKLETNHWLCGDAFTLADCALIPCLGNLATQIQLLDYEQLHRYWQQAKLRGSVQQVNEEVELATHTISKGE